MTDRTDKPMWAPGAGLAEVQARAELLAEIRAYFSEQAVLEVETPHLTRAGNSDPGIQSFIVSPSGRYLRTSAEYAMKRLLAAGSGDIYELGHVYRAGEQGRNHNPEFTMLEWYRCDWNYHQLMDEVSRLVRRCLPGSSLDESRISYRDLLRAYADTDPLTDPDRRLQERVKTLDYSGPELDRNGMLDLLVSLLVQPQLPDEALTFVYDYPPEQAALARLRDEPVPVAERFELFLGRTELANGYQELTDPIEQRRRFELENTQRKARGEPSIPLDEHLLDALAAGLPECAGVALGVDRLLMRRTGAESLDAVLTFSADRA
jgi:elongation factor P--(R)-beta-lysine ligase